MKQWIAMLLILALCAGLMACGAEPETTAAVPTAPVTAGTSDLRGQRLGLGSQMPDFTISDALGNSYTLYELLEEKQMVMLNFWFIDCPYCVMEFPSIQAAYSQYSDQIAILAVNPVDTAPQIVGFCQEYGLTFTMCQDGPGLSEAFGIKGYPTTVIVDRYGVVCLVQAGAVPYEEVFLNVFAHFTAENYETKRFYSIQEFY